jgi:hypothetical protein
MPGDLHRGPVRKSSTPPVSTQFANVTNPDCILTASGWGQITVPILALDFGMNVYATEDMGRDNRIFYPMQVQQDQFIVSAVFTRKSSANTFNRWIWRYAEFASTPGMQGVVMGCRVQVPVRGFDMMGFPVSGFNYHWAPVTLTDVIWVVTINFDAGSVVGDQAWVGPNSAAQYFQPTNPDNMADQVMFYPAYYEPGSKQYTGDPSDAIYR